MANGKPQTSAIKTWSSAWLRENRGLILFVLCFGVFRTAVADWNPVPTGSMRPSILEGDVVLVNRLAYDAKLPLSDISLAPLGEPQRGDVVVFASPQNGTRLIKRLVGLPGDEIELRGNALFINGEAAAYSDFAATTETVGAGFVVAAKRATETVAGHSRRVLVLRGFGDLSSAPKSKDMADKEPHFGPMRVPEGHYFMLGDNRDNSEDSRFIGPVPRRLLAGRAQHILVSADITDRWQPRWERWVAALR
ncbi:signal peptidase I [Roseateles sp.]|uniref:signal peptidase I n=1 Tax=Roseateles sp. TaxID=1971397 RepID=UPI003BA4F0DF